MRKYIGYWSLPPLAVLSGLLTAGSACGATQWPVPNANHVVDFGAEDSGAKPVFCDDGMAMEIDLEFLLVKHTRVTVRGKIQGRGRFDIEQGNPKALAEIVRKEPTLFEIVPKVSAMDGTDVDKKARERMIKLAEPHLKAIRAEANYMKKEELRELLQKRKAEIPRAEDKEKELEEIRKIYVDLRTVDAVAPDLRKRLGELAAAHSEWVSSKDQASWDSATPAQLRDECYILTRYEIMDDHLKRCGLGFESNIPGYRRRLESRMDAAYVVMAGKAGEDPVASSAVSQAFGPDDVERLRAALTVKLRCRFFQEADPQDANSQWFNAQRVACRAKGVGVIRIEGKLDPTKHDRADWWFLEGYNPATVLLKADEPPGSSMDSPLVCEGGARVRFVAKGNKPTDYAFELQPVGAGEGAQRVLIHESPSWTGAKFPF